MGLFLHCALEELGCGTTSLDSYAYSLDYPDNCVLSILRTEDVNMVMQDRKYYVLSAKDSTSKFVFEVKNNPQKHLQNPHLFTRQITIHYTWPNSVKVSIWKPEKVLAARKMVQLKYFSIWDLVRKTILVNFMRITLKERTQFRQEEKPDSYLNMDYEIHLGTKIDYLLFQSSRLLQATEIQLLQNQCAQERTQILTNLMQALETPRLAGYMLTGNRSMFLETDGSLAWLYHCPMVHSPLHRMSQCYDRIPILYEGEIRFVDPITRQT